MSIWNSPTLGKNLGVLRTANSITQRHTDYKMSFSGGQVSWNANPDTDFTVASGSQHSNSSELRTLKFCLFRIWTYLGTLLLVVVRTRFCRDPGWVCLLPPRSSDNAPWIFLTPYEIPWFSLRRFYTTLFLCRVTMIYFRYIESKGRSSWHEFLLIEEKMCLFFKLAIQSNLKTITFINTFRESLGKGATSPFLEKRRTVRESR